MAVTPKYTVIGSDVAHSLSPAIFAGFSAQSGQPLSYDITQLPAETDQQAWLRFLETFVQSGGCGANVTTPFKRLAFQTATHCTARAKAAGAVNTLIYQNGDWLGDNTDGAGLLVDWQARGINAKDKVIGIIGAGGAVQGILPAILSLGAKTIWLANRTRARAEALVAQTQPSPLRVAEWDNLPYADILIHATASRQQFPQCAQSAQLKNTICFDLQYTPDCTPFMAWAKSQGAQHCYSGLRMLEAQARETFKCWFGYYPEEQKA